MLWLTRKPNEGIMIGNNIEIVVTTITKGKVTIGIKAPADILVLRKELIGRGKEKNPRPCLCLGMGCDRCCLPGTY